MLQKTTAALLVVFIVLSLFFQAMPAHAYQVTLTASDPAAITYQQKAAIRKACIKLGLGDFS
jgi:preprotein translocase subunit SecG